MPFPAPFPEYSTPRNGFERPRLRILPLDQEGRPVGHLPWWTNRLGDEVPSLRPCLRMGWSEDALVLEAHVDDPIPVRLPKPAPEAFWRQDHVELRLVLDPQNPGSQIQILVASDGRHQVHGIEGLEVRCTATIRSAGWGVSLRLDRRRLAAAQVICPLSGLPLLRGLVSLTRWGRGFPDSLVLAPVELGFAQHERFVDFLLAPASSVHLVDLQAQPGPLTCDPVLDLRLRSCVGGFRSGAVVAWTSTGMQPRPSLRLSIPATESDEVVLQLPLRLDRPAFTTLHLAWEDARGTHALGQFSLRAGIPDAALPEGRRHPYLLFTTEAIAQLRERGLAPTPSPTPPILGQGPYFRSEERVSWHRFAVEVTNRDNPRYARIAERLDEPTRACCLRVASGPKISDADRDELVVGLNRLLDRTDLYDPAVWTGTNPALVAALARSDSPSIVLRNRLLLQACNPLAFPSAGLDLVQGAVACFRSWLAEPNTDAVERATAWIRLADHHLVMGAHIDLQEGNVAPGLALAYDAFCPLLNAEDRAVWVRVLGRFVDLHLRTAREQFWTTTCIPNANAVCNGGGGLVALALLDEHPDARESLRLARSFLPFFADWCQNPDGSNTEGAQYWQYGLTSCLVFAWNLERALGTDDALLGRPQFRQAWTMIAGCLTNDGAMHGVNDTIPMAMGRDIAATAALRHDDARCAWYVRHLEQWHASREAAGRPKTYGEAGLISPLLHPDPIPGYTPEFPRLQHVTDAEWAILRSEPRWDARITVSLKGCRSPYTHHNQPDVGAISLEVAGERLLIDPGYYKEKPQEHCLVEVDGHLPRQGREHEGRILRCGESRDSVWAACDASRAYGGGVSKVDRLVVVVGDEAVVILDEIIPLEGAPGRVRAWWQGGGPTRAPAKSTVTVTGERSTLRVDVDGTLRDATLLPERDLHDTHWGYHFADCRWFPWHWDLDASLPVITVIQVDAQRAVPQVRRSHAKLATVVLDGGLGLDLVRTIDGWVPG